MPLEREAYWIKWYDDYVPGTTNDDYPVPLGRSVALEGIGGWRESTDLLFQFYFVWQNGRTTRLLPRESTIAAEDSVGLSVQTVYNQHPSAAELPMSTFVGRDVASIRVTVINSNVGNQEAAGHFRGVYLG